MDAIVNKAGRAARRLQSRCGEWRVMPRRRAAGVLREERAQGTTEYAILVGVLVVIAIVAIVAFRDKVSELWNAISSGINSL